MKLNRTNGLLLAGLALVGALGLLLVWEFREYITRENVVALVEQIAAMGPIAFFGLMATLPLIGAPLSPFLLIAPVFGIETAIIGAFVALAVNMALSWFVSGKWFRPLFARLIGRFGYSIPEVSPKRMVGFAVLLRITPGMPFPVQNYLLGLARMPFVSYMLVSVAIQWTVSASIILLGESFLQGNAQLAAIAIVATIIVALVLRYLRQRLAAKRIGEAERMEAEG